MSQRHANPLEDAHTLPLIAYSLLSQVFTGESVLSAGQLRSVLSKSEVLGQGGKGCATGLCSGRRQLPACQGDLSVKGSAILTITPTVPISSTNFRRPYAPPQLGNCRAPGTTNPPVRRTLKISGPSGWGCAVGGYHPRECLAISGAGATAEDRRHH